jgi:hypothetical protein
MLFFLNNRPSITSQNIMLPNCGLEKFSDISLMYSYCTKSCDLFVKGGRIMDQNLDLKYRIV